MEAILDPELTICDPHHHLWDRFDPPYMLPELRADTGSGHHVVATVFVECGSGYREDGPEAFRPVGETDFVVRADPGGFVAGIVSFADLRRPEVDDVLAAHVDAGAGRFRGIRMANAWDPGMRPGHTDPPPHLLADPAFRSGVAALGRAGLSLDVWSYHPQLAEVTDLARAQPDVPIVLDHLGGPVGIGPYTGRRDEVLGGVRTALVGLAACPNVVVKLGGIGMTIYGLDFHKQPGGATAEQLADAWGPEVRFCIEQFGVDRCMFESNFPVDKPSCSYATLWNAFKLMVADASAGEKAALFHDTAARVYRLVP